MMSPDLVASETKHCWNGRKELTHLWTRGSLIDAPLVLAPAPFVELDLVLLFAAKGELPSTETGAGKGKAPHLAVKLWFSSMCTTRTSSFMSLSRYSPLMVS